MNETPQLVGVGPILVVAGAIVRPGHEVFLTQRDQPSIPEAHGKWQLPGGKVEWGEHPTVALLRELAEEVGEAEPYRYLGVKSKVWASRSPLRDIHVIMMTWACRPVGEMRESETARWFSRSDLPDMIDGDRELINELQFFDFAKAYRVPTR